MLATGWIGALGVRTNEDADPALARFSSGGTSKAESYGASAGSFRHLFCISAKIQALESTT
eukprot:15481023-Alexandrium_andersonii.AAC.1